MRMEVIGPASFSATIQYCPSFMFTIVAPVTVSVRRSREKEYCPPDIRSAGSDWGSVDWNHQVMPEGCRGGYSRPELAKLMERSSPVMTARDSSIGVISGSTEVNGGREGEKRGRDG